MIKIMKKTVGHIFGAGFTPYIIALALIMGVVGGMIGAIKTFEPEYISVELFGTLLGVFLEMTVKVWLIMIIPVAIMSFITEMNERLTSPKGSDAEKRTEKNIEESDKNVTTSTESPKIN